MQKSTGLGGFPFILSEHRSRRGLALDGLYVSSLDSPTRPPFVQAVLGLAGSGPFHVEQYRDEDCHRSVYLLPEELVEKVAKFHLHALGAELMVFTQEHPDCVRATSNLVIPLWSQCDRVRFRPTRKMFTSYRRSSMRKWRNTFPSSLETRVDGPCEGADESFVLQEELFSSTVTRSLWIRKIELWKALNTSFPW